MFGVFGGGLQNLIPLKGSKMVLNTHLEPFREPLKVPPVGQPKNPFFLRVYIYIDFCI